MTLVDWFGVMTQSSKEQEHQELFTQFGLNTYSAEPSSDQKHPLENKVAIGYKVNHLWPINSSSSEQWK